MSGFGNRAAADFARLLDSGATAGPGMALVAQLRTAGAAFDASVAPRPEFRNALRKRLLAVATVSGAQAQAPVRAPARVLPAAVSWRRRGSTVAAGALASVVAITGVAVAGSQSLPGDPFYGVKRTTEALQLQLAGSDVEKGTRHLDFAATRLREVRGLTLGRDAADAGPVLGPSALAGGIALRSGERPLAAGAALSAGVADRVRSTLADMDEQTREGTELLTEAYRSSQAAEPLRALNRFATRQSAGLEQLLPALPPAATSRARASLALLTDVEETTEELIRIGTCGASCDPTTAAPTVPVVPGSPAPSPAPSSSAGSDCECPAPVPAPDPRPSVEPTPEPGATTDPRPTPTRSPDPQPSSPTPSPTPSEHPLPLPSLPVPIPSLPVPVPTLTLVPAPVAEALEPLLPGLSGSASSEKGPAAKPAPAPKPAPVPAPQLAPLPPRP